MNLPYRQQGASLGSIMFGVAIIGMAALIAIKLFPPYFESYQVKSSIESVATEANNETMTPLEIRDKINKRFGINDVKGVGMKDIKIGREGYNYIITVDYTVQTHFIHNIDFLIKFENRAEVKAF